MNRTDLVVILLVAIVGTVVMLQSVQNPNQHSVFESKTNSVQIEIDQHGAEIADATHRLIYHCKMVAVESIIIVKTSINVVLDTAIRSLD